MAKLEPLRQKAPDKKRQQKKIGSPSGGAGNLPATRVSPALVEAWKKALDVSERDLSEFIPTDAALQVAEGILTGAVSPTALSAHTGLSDQRVKAVLHDPVAMAWVSRSIHELFRHRAGMVDAALYTRAIAGDISAIKLFYEVMGHLDRVVRHEFSGSIDVREMPLEDLEKLVHENSKLIPAEYTVHEPGGSGEEVPGTEGNSTPDPGVSTAVLPPAPGAPREATDVSREGEDLPPSPLFGRESER